MGLNEGHNDRKDSRGTRQPAKICRVRKLPWELRPCGEACGTYLGAVRRWHNPSADYTSIQTAISRQTSHLRMRLAPLPQSGSNLGRVTRIGTTTCPPQTFRLPHFPPMPKTVPVRGSRHCAIKSAPPSKPLRRACPRMRRLAIARPGASNAHLGSGRITPASPAAAA